MTLLTKEQEYFFKDMEHYVKRGEAFYADMGLQPTEKAIYYIALKFACADLRALRAKKNEVESK